MSISFKSKSNALQMLKVTLRTFYDPYRTVTATTVCTPNASAPNPFNDNVERGTYTSNGQDLLCTEEEYRYIGDVYWQYAPDGTDGHTPSQAYSFTFKGDDPVNGTTDALGDVFTGGLPRAYGYHNDANKVLNVIIEVEVTQSGARPARRRRLGQSDSSLSLIDDGGSRSLRLLSEDDTVESVVLSLPVVPTPLITLPPASSSNGTTVVTIPQTIINQYHTIHNDNNESSTAVTFSLVLSTIAVTVLVLGLVIWVIRRRWFHVRQNGALSSSKRYVTTPQAYGESTPMLSMRGLHVA